MKAYSSAQKLTFAAFSAAALATATATAVAYYVYRTHRRDTQSDQKPSDGAVDSPDNIGEQTQSPPPETSAHSSSQLVQQPDHTTVPNITKVETTTTNSFSWAVFWDIENVPVPKTISATHFVQALRNTLADHRKQTPPDSILRIQAIANLRRTSVHLRHHLQANGVNVTHVESKGRKDAADKALITEICLITREHPTPFGVCLISGDGDFSYPVSRLAALGYTTVVVAPTRQSFSTLLAAVPDAVIPLHTVLEAYDDPSLEPEVLRMATQQTRHHSVPVPVPLLTPLHVSRRAEKRVTRRKRRERLVPPASVLEREDDCCRQWSSDDDRSAVRLSDYRTSRRPSQPNAFSPQSALQRSHILASQFGAPYLASAANSRASQPQLMPPANGPVQLQVAARRKGDHLDRDNGRQTNHQPMNGSASRPRTGSVGRTMGSKNRDMDNVRASRSNTDDRKRTANGPRVHFAEDTIIPDPDEQRQQPTSDDFRQRSGSRSVEQKSRLRKKGESKKQASSTGSRDTSEASTGAETYWFYSGARALPFLVLLLVLGLSLFFTSLRVASAVLEVLYKV